MAHESGPDDAHHISKKEAAIIGTAAVAGAAAFTTAFGMWKHIQRRGQETPHDQQLPPPEVPESDPTDNS